VLRTFKPARAELSCLSAGLCRLLARFLNDYRFLALGTLSLLAAEGRDSLFDLLRARGSRRLPWSATGRLPREAANRSCKVGHIRAGRGCIIYL